MFWGWVPLSFLHWEALCLGSRQWKHFPSRMHLALSVGVSLDKMMVSTSMAFRSEVVWGVDEYEEKGSLPPFRARMRIFCTWKVFACSIQVATVVGMVAMERTTVASCWSSPSENWSMRVTSSVIPALAERFWKSVIYFWNPSSMIPLGHLKDFWDTEYSLLVVKMNGVEEIKG